MKPIKAGHRITRITLAFEAGRDWLLAGALAHGTRHRGPRHSCIGEAAIASLLSTLLSEDIMVTFCQLRDRIVRRPDHPRRGDGGVA